MWAAAFRIVCNQERISSLAATDPRGRSRNFLLGWGEGVQTLVQKELLNFFVANYFLQRRPRVS